MNKHGGYHYIGHQNGSLILGEAQGLCQQDLPVSFSRGTLTKKGGEKGHPAGGPSGSCDSPASMAIFATPWSESYPRQPRGDARACSCMRVRMLSGSKATPHFLSALAPKTVQTVYLPLEFLSQNSVVQ